MTASTPPDLNTKMTERARIVWSLGDFARAGAEQVIVGELLARAIDIHPGERFLDVAAGSRNAALAAARRGASVTATDFVPTLLETAARRAQVEGLELETREADAQDLPFPDATFDVVLSTFGVIFAPDQAGAAAELLRVCRPGGRIGLTAWTPDSVMAAIQAIAAQCFQHDRPTRCDGQQSRPQFVMHRRGEARDDMARERALIRADQALSTMIVVPQIGLPLLLV